LFTGFRSDLDALWPDIDLFLFTSRTEGLGTSILDALAHGIPVVSTNAGGITEIISHLDSGYLAEVGDAQGLAEGVRTVLGNADLYRKLVDGGYKKVREFDKRKTAEKTMQSYNHAMIQ
jgi:glycosyltransferase involved in cell wall biosynthesis